MVAMLTENQAGQRSHTFVAYNALHQHVVAMTDSNSALHSMPVMVTCRMQPWVTMAMRVYRNICPNF